MIQINNWPSKYFAPEEVLSPGSIKLFLNSGLVILDYDALKSLDELREFIAVPLKCNFADLQLRGTRTPDENASIKGSAKNSTHILGKAFDISATTLSVDELYGKIIQFAEKTKKVSGVGIYPTWVHVDFAWRPNAKLTIWNKRD